MPTPALVVKGVPPACYEHLSLGRVARHLSVALFLTTRETGSGLPVALRSRILGRSHSKTCVCSVHTDQCHRNPLSEVRLLLWILRSSLAVRSPRVRQHHRQDN